MSLRAAKRSSTRTAIEHAAWSLAVDREWAEITIDDIAAGAGVARRTFFNYFESKEQLLGSLGGWRPGALLAAFQERPGTEDPWSSLRTAMLGLLAGSPRESIERMQAMWREPVLLEQHVAGRRQLERGLTDEIRRRRPEWTPLESVLLGAVFLTTSRVAIQSWVDEGECGELADAVAVALDAVTVRTELGELLPPGIRTGLSEL